GCSAGTTSSTRPGTGCTATPGGWISAQLAEQLVDRRGVAHLVRDSLCSLAVGPVAEHRLDRRPDLQSMVGADALDGGRTGCGLDHDPGTGRRHAARVARLVGEQR